MDNILTMLRVLINDPLGETYSDDSLTKLILVAAIVIQKELHFTTTYTVDLSVLTISPEVSDDAFMLFAAHKAAILLTQSEIRTNSSRSIKITDGPSTIDLSSVAKDLMELLKNLITQYDRMKMDYTLHQNEGAAFGYAVLTPTTVTYISPHTYN